MARKKTGKKGTRRKRKKSTTRIPISPKMLKSIKDFEPESRVVMDPKGQAKMSEVLLDFAQPLLNHVGDNERGFRVSIALAAYAWNTSLLPEEEWGSNIDEMIKGLSLPEDGISMSRYYVEMLIQRRIKDFSNMERLIVRYEISKSKMGSHLNVASTLLENESQ